MKKDYLIYVGLVIATLVIVYFFGDKIPFIQDKFGFKPAPAKAN